jgi:hypothetical protein
MTQLRSRLQLVGSITIAAGFVWASGMVASALPQSERLPAAVHSTRVVDYATDIVIPGSRFGSSRPTYDQ